MRVIGTQFKEVSMTKAAGLTCGLLFLLVISASSALVAGPVEYSITRFTVDGGGGRSTAGSFTLTGTIGQFDASSQNAIGPNYSIQGGFWARVADILFKDGFEGD
jgi:hypothetical protein